MKIIIKILIGFIAIIHCYILWFEMFAWETVGKGVFKSFPDDLFTQTKVLAANQGLYNGFLAAGLIWALFIKNEEWDRKISLFFLVCVCIAGIYGAFTVQKSIFFTQSLPAIITISLIIIDFKRKNNSSVGI